MNANEILELVRAGYTKQEIDAMGRENAAEQANAENDPVPADTAQAPENEPSQATEAKTEHEPPVSPGTELDRLYREIANLTKAMQANNRASADMGANIIEPQQAAINTMRELSSIPAPKE